MQPMRLSDVYAEGRFGLSIEIFPPKTENGETALRGTLDQLASYQPAFVSCTYGAGGSSREKTIEWCADIQRRHGATATAHFTCVGSPRDELLEWLDEADSAGIRNIMALRGDPPEGQQNFRPVPDGLKYANELVELIREHQPEWGIGVAGYPETHQEAPDSETDLANLKRKVDAGADAVFTQLFYDNDDYLRFRDRCAAIGIRVPIVPGIMPITEFARIQRITQMCGASVPSALAKRLEGVKSDKASQFEIGVQHAIEQCVQLRSEGAAGIHLYALNRADACSRILDSLGETTAQRRAA